MHLIHSPKGQEINKMTVTDERKSEQKQIDMELPVEAPKIIADGLHKGVIVDVERRTTPHDYTDIVIEFEDGIKLKCGYPTKVMDTSRLGKLLMRFGASLKVGSKINPYKLLVGKECEFITIRDGQYSNVEAKSVKPIGYTGSQNM